ncbi:MAG: penicillin acylase family protein [Candidatus Latescibacter sp.]|nr:penicillin acylase family protein [Candidatus Latescibacter sp.]
MRSIIFVIFLLLFLPGTIMAQKTISYKVKGLSQKAEILLDRWGVPHIYGKTEEDMFFAQGFNAARDRLWQLDLWRRQGEGKLAEAFGPRFLEKDKAARLFLYRGDREKEFRSYHPRGKKILNAFTDGINAWIDLTKADPKLLPLEFKLTGVVPGYWTPSTPLIRIFGLTRNAGREDALARLVHLMGAEAVEKMHVFEPPAKLSVPEGLDLSLFDGRALEKYNLARAAITFRPEDLAAGIPSEERELYARLLSQPQSDQAENSSASMYESNNWTISGKLTSTGAPILCGDPHRAHTIPSLRYIAHLSGPGWNVIGAGEPAIPGISLGHNEKIAFAITIFSFADEEDLYVYDTNPANPEQYRYKGRWEKVKTIEETFTVKGGPPVKARLAFTRHGPVIHEDRAHNKAYALRAAYLEHEGTAVYLAGLRLNQARNWQEFLEGMYKHYCPSLNVVYADVDGNIGWFGGSLAPVRPNWNGLLPVPGNGEYEWKGFLDTKLLPCVFNPKEGFFATANQYNLPEGYKYVDVSAREWTSTHRLDRIKEVLGSGSKLTVESSMQLQLDELSLPARELAPLLSGLSSPDPEVNKALNLLRNWDFVLSQESVPAAIFELWSSYLHDTVFPLYLPAAARFLFGSGDRRILDKLLFSPDAAFLVFGPNPTAGRDAALLKSLEQAVKYLKDKLGSDMTRWTWGSLHHMKYEHALSAALSSGDSNRDVLNTVSAPKGGDGFTVNNTGYRRSDFRQTGGASYRQVMDLGDWDNSVAINTPGQSGDPKSPHYEDLFPLWAEDKYFPLSFSRKNVERVTEEIVILEPK